MTEVSVSAGPGGHPIEPAELIRLAVHAAGRADEQSWQLAVEQATAIDLAVADHAAQAELAERLAGHGVRAGMLVEIAAGAAKLAEAAADGPFRCPAYLIELAIRRALAEPGCTEFVDVPELVFATTQVAGMVELHDALLPPGWGWAVHGSLGDD